MKATNSQITTALQGLKGLYFSDYQLAKATPGSRHLRGGKITKADSKEGAGVEVYGFGFDELWNCVALCKDGSIRQFIGN